MNSTRSQSVLISGRRTMTHTRRLQSSALRRITVIAAILCACATNGVAGGGIAGLYKNGDPRTNDLFVPREYLESVVIARIVSLEPQYVTFNNRRKAARPHVRVEVLEYVLGSGARLKTVIGPGPIDVDDGRVTVWACSECIPLEVGSIVLLVLSKPAHEVFFSLPPRQLPRVTFAREMVDPQAGLESASGRPVAYDADPLNALLKSGDEVDLGDMQVLIEEEVTAIRDWVDSILEHYGDTWPSGGKQ